MPIRGAHHSPLIGDEAPYFKTLQELDEWASTPTVKLTGCLPYRPRSDLHILSENRGKLLVSFWVILCGVFIANVSRRSAMITRSHE